MSSQLPVMEAKTLCLYHTCAGNLACSSLIKAYSYRAGQKPWSLLSFWSTQKYSFSSHPLFLGDRTVAQLLCVFYLKQKPSGEKISKNY